MATRGKRERIRVGFLGAGDWGRSKHLPALAAFPDVEVSLLCERDPGIRDAVAREHGIARTCADVEALADDETLDCYVVVIDPHRLPEVLPRLARRGVPVFTEKPPGATAAAASGLAASVTVPNIVGFNRRWFPIVERFKGLLEHTPGIYHVSALFARYERYDSRIHRESGGTRSVPFMTGTGVHTVNTLEYLFGEIAVAGVQVRDVPGKGHPYWRAGFDFAGGAAGDLTVMSLSGTSTERIEAHSPERAFVLTYSMYSPVDYPGRIVVHEKGAPAEVIEGDASAPRLVNEGFIGEYTEFFEIVRGRRETCRSSLASSVNSVRVAEEMEAAWRGSA